MIEVPGKQLSLRMNANCDSDRGRQTVRFGMVGAYFRVRRPHFFLGYRTMFNFLSRRSRSTKLACINRESLSESSFELAKAEAGGPDERPGTILCTTYFDIALFPPDLPDEDVPIAYPDSEPTILPDTTMCAAVATVRSQKAPVPKAVAWAPNQLTHR